MTKHRFSYIERYALWKAYDGRCFYCEEPLDFQDMSIDHVVPERFVGYPDELAQFRRDYDIDENFPNFQVNDFANWVPAHPRKCNTRKGSEVFSKKMMLLILHEVQRRLPAVEKQLTLLRKERGRARIFGSLGTAIENQNFSIADVREFLSQVESEQYVDESLVLTFGVITDDLFEQDHGIPLNISYDYPHLCDWLELDLVKHLRAIVPSPFHHTQPSERSGESLSVRIVFPELNIDSLDNFDRPWWKILEALNFWELFGYTYQDAFPELPSHGIFGQLEPG
ncbi:HNH endonuclease signature motif containing protein [Desulfobacterales bacterium HSG2]|nr:HNH endonuclease signature motif containing protein [Desulfobacterales bacterium HSG2]